MSEGIKPEPLCHTQIFEFLAWTSYRKKIHCLPSLVRNICGNWTLLFPCLGDFGPEREVKSQQHTSCRGYLRAFNPFFFFFFSVTESHIGNVLNQPRSDKQRSRYMPNPHGENHQKMGICWISACFLPGFPQTVLASTRVWTLPMPAKSRACSAKCDIAKETGKGCYKVILSPQKNGKSSNKM